MRILALFGLFLTGFQTGLAGENDQKCEYFLYDVKPLCEIYRLLDDENEVRYFGMERFDKQVFFKDGKIIDANGQGFNSYSISMLNFRAIWVMDGFGNFFATNEQLKEYIHHSSLINGGPVAAAGEMVCWRGKLKYLNDSSGHYAPRRRNFDNALREFRDGLGDEAMSTVRIERLGR